MSSDLKIEIFAYKLFDIWWNASNMIKTKTHILKIYGDECKKVYDYEEVCDDLFLNTISFRHLLFNKIYKVEFTDEKAKNLKSIIDLYDYIITTCDREDLFGHLSVFQRMFATLNFVQLICAIHQRVLYTIDVVKYGRHIWTMYFDKYTEEFYEKGGWKELKKEARRLSYMTDVALQFNGDSLLNIQVIKQSCDNYNHFKNFVIYEQKQANPIHISYVWIKFHIEYFERYIYIPLIYEISMDAYEMELLFENLKLLLNPSTCTPNDIQIHKKENQDRAFTHKISTEKINANLDDSKAEHVTFVYESTIIDKSSDDFSQISTTNLEESQGRCSTSATDEFTFDIMDSNRNEKLYEYTIIEMKQQRKTSKEDPTAILNTDHNNFIGKEIKRRPKTSDKNSSNVSDFELNPSFYSKSHLDKKEESSIRNFNGENAGHTTQNEAAIINQLFYINLAEETEYNKHNSRRDQAHSILAKRSVDNLNGKKYPETKQEINPYSSTEELKECSNATDVVSTSYIGASDIDGLTLEPFPNELKPVNGNVNEDDERKRIRKAMKNLRSEQEDSEVKNILKLLLVLGCKEEIEFIFLSLQNEKEAPEKLQKKIK